MTGASKSHRDAAARAERVVFVIDDDMAMRETLSSLFRSVGLRVELFGSTREFAQVKMPDAASCLVLDVRLPGLSGLDFQAELAKADIHIPIIFMTGHGDIPMSVQAMKAGAIDFLTKPFRDQEMLDAVVRAHEPEAAGWREGCRGTADPARFFDSPRARSDRICRKRSDEQADRGQIGRHRDHGEGAPRQYDEKDEGAIGDRPGRNGQLAWNPTCELGSLYSGIVFRTPSLVHL